jgi:hypothetical protein
VAITFPVPTDTVAAPRESGEVREPQPAESVDPERRIAERRPAALVPSITGVRLSPSGGEASLVNISTTGVLLKANVRLMPGTIVTVNVDGPFRPASIAGRVVRCSVTDIDSKGVLWYHVGAVFNRPITLEDAPVATIASPAPAQVPAPAPQPSELRIVYTAPKNRW